MAQTLLQLQKQIAALEAKAAKIRQTEAKGVISKIRAAIDAYGFTAEDLFGKSAAKSTGARRARSMDAKYSDGKGNTWVGRGKRPDWLRNALAAGADLSDFAQGTGAASGAPADGNGAEASPAAKKAQGRKSSARKASNAKYQDGAGKSWSGRGRRPKWIVDALAAGKSVQDFAV
jgi:DNA-binding protein H-NS